MNLPYKTAFSYSLCQQRYMFDFISLFKLQAHAPKTVPLTDDATSREILQDHAT